MRHDLVEQRSLEFHRAVVAKLRDKPELLSVAHENLDRWSHMGSRSQPYWDQWRAILSGPFEEVLAVIAEDTQKMRDLRQSSPFAGVLTPKERWQVYDTFASRTHHTGVGRDR